MNTIEETLSLQEALDQLNQFDLEVGEKKGHFIGYPINAHIELRPFFEWWAKSIASHSPLNDVGNPYQDLPYMINTRPFERSVLEIFAKLLKFAPSSSWGYVTSGGTLSNEQGLLIGRESLKGFGKPVLYFSEDSHYSIMSVAKMLEIEFKVIHSQLSGEIDYEDFEKQLDPAFPVLINLNIGSTFKGAIDKSEKIDAILQKKHIKHAYIHLDAALFGGFLPFLNNDCETKIDFSKGHIDSIAISGHKFFGSPIPMGIFLVKKEHLDLMHQDFVDYIYTKNVTIPCSRSSLNSLLFWWILRTKSLSEWKKDAHEIMDNAHYLFTQLQKRDSVVYRDSDSNIVYFQSPSEELCKKWSLAQVHCPKLGKLAHIVVMQHVTKDVLDEFLIDFDEELKK